MWRHRQTYSDYGLRAVWLTVCGVIGMCVGVWLAWP